MVNWIIKIALEDGRVEYSGNPEDFARSPHFQGLLRDEEEEHKGDVEEIIPSGQEDSPTVYPQGKSEKLIIQETRQEGGISASSYFYFLSSCVSLDSLN